MRFNLILLLIPWLGSVFAVFGFSSVSNASKVTKLSSFSWSECGSSSELVQVHSIQLAPDPILIPGNVSLALQASVSLQENSPLPLSLTLKKKVTFFWLTIPCVNGTGSCDYKDLCALLPIPNPCPTAFKTHSIPCECPLKSGNYNLPLSPVFSINSGSLPSWLESGDYRLEIRANDNNDNEILCLDLSLTVQTD